MFMRFKDGKTKALTLSYDDGVEQDIRLLELMEKYNVKGTFNINSGLFTEEGTVFEKGRVHRRMTQKIAYDLYQSPMAEVAVHGKKHGFLNKLPTPLILEDVFEDRKNLEEMFGKMIRGMAYPYGKYNDDVIEALRLSGIVYSRTTESTGDFSLPEEWLTWGTTCHHKSPKLKELTEKFINDNPTNDPYLFYLWGHSYEFEYDDNWNVIEEFLADVSGKDDVWYATNIEIYEYIEAYKHLIYSADGKIIKNPTVIDVWVAVEGAWENGNRKVYKIAAGETITIK